MVDIGIHAVRDAAARHAAAFARHHDHQHRAARDHYAAADATNEAMQDHGADGGGVGGSNGGHHAG